MKNQSPPKPFAFDLGEADIRAERHKARRLRASQWWKRRLAKGRCHWCEDATPAKELTMDHIVPVARGGKSTKGNVVTACKQCNNKKKQLLPMEWETYVNSIRRSNQEAPEELEEPEELEDSDG